MTGLVMCSGSVKNYEYIRKYIKRADIIICADGGAEHLGKLGITPDILVGDFDSITEARLDAMIKAGAEVVRFPAEKDTTDTELAIGLAADRGCDEVILLGATGTRLDHTLANIFLLRQLLDAGKSGFIADENNEIRLTGSKITLTRERDSRISLVPVGGRVTGVTTEGMYYPLKNATLEFGTTWGVSNEFLSDTASVTVTEGLLLVMESWD